MPKDAQSPCLLFDIPKTSVASRWPRPSKLSDHPNAGACELQDRGRVYDERAAHRGGAAAGSAGRRARLLQAPLLVHSTCSDPYVPSDPQPTLGASVRLQVLSGKGPRCQCVANSKLDTSEPVPCPQMQVFLRKQDSLGGCQTARQETKARRSRRSSTHSGAALADLYASPMQKRSRSLKPARSSGHEIVLTTPILLRAALIFLGPHILRSPVSCGTAWSPWRA